MKSERRHELTTNALADWLGGIIEWIRPYQTTLLGIVLLATLWHRGRRPVDQAVHTTRRPRPGSDLATPNPAAWDNLAKQQPTTPVGCLAGIRAGDHCLSKGWQQRFVDQAKANQYLANAVDFYERVQKNASLPLLRERATFGLARTLETQGKLVEAAKQYETLKTGTYADDADQAIGGLAEAGNQGILRPFRPIQPQAAQSRRGPRCRPSPTSSGIA